MMFSGLGLRIALIAFAAAAIFFGGYRVDDNARQAARARVMAEAIKARQVDEEKTQLVVTAYEVFIAELKRLKTVNRVELTREVTKEVYRCPLPAESLGLLNSDSDAANATRQPNASVRPDTKPESAGSGRTGDSLFGTDGDVR